MMSVYIDPYRGHVVGKAGSEEASRLDTFFNATLLLHRQLFLGSTGRVLVELTVGWTIILIASGLYLWWPKKVDQILGVWWPRVRAKPYTILRDLHSVAGFYLLLPALIIAITGLFYSLVWSEAFYRATHNGKGSVVEKKREKQADKPAPTRPILTVDRIESIARSRYPDRNIEITLPSKPGDPYSVRAGNDFSRPYGEYVSAQFTIDAVEGTILSHKTLAEDDRFWWHGWVYPLHVGSIFGLTTKVLWLIASLVLAGLPITGLWMWLKRRPARRMGFPRKPEREIPIPLILGIILLAVVMPLVGASIVLIVGGERAISLISRTMAIRAIS